MNNPLRSRLIRLAHEKPELRPHLLPLLKNATSNEVEKTNELKNRVKKAKIHPTSTWDDNVRWCGAEFALGTLDVLARSYPEWKFSDLEREEAGGWLTLISSDKNWRVGVDLKITVKGELDGDIRVQFLIFGLNPKSGGYAQINRPFFHKMGGGGGLSPRMLAREIYKLLEKDLVDAQKLWDDMNAPRLEERW